MQFRLINPFIKRFSKELRLPQIFIILSSRLAAVIFVTAYLTCVANAQTGDFSIVVSTTSPAHVHIEARISGSANTLLFRDSYAGVNGLSGRIKNLSGTDAEGVKVLLRKRSDQEYETVEPVSVYNYDVDLTPPLRASDTSHVSWLTNERGVLMLGDLLPLHVKSGQVNLHLAQNWDVATVEARVGGLFSVKDISDAVFFVGHNVRERRRRIGASDVVFATDATWSYDDNEVIGAVSDLVKEHERIVGKLPHRNVLLLLLPFPQPVEARRWSAEARGATIVFVAGKNSSRVAGLTTLTVALAHETFHLWVPNGLALEGNYDWFYEGFTLYQALRTCVRLGICSFKDYLQALARSYDDYLGAGDSANISLVAASNRRWKDNDQVVYTKGFLVAFIFDVGIRQATANNRSLENVYSELFVHHKLGQPRMNGNNAVINILNRTADTSELTRLYVLGNEPIDLRFEAAKVGLRVERVAPLTTIRLADKLDKQRKEILRDLGSSLK